MIPVPSPRSPPPVDERDARNAHPGVEDRISTKRDASIGQRQFGSRRIDQQVERVARGEFVLLPQPLALQPEQLHLIGAGSGRLVGLITKKRRAADEDPDDEEESSKSCCGRDRHCALQ